METTEVISRIEQELRTCENPLQWDPRTTLEMVPHDMIERFLIKLKERDNRIESNQINLEDLMLYIGLSYEYASENNIDRALETLKVAKNKVPTVFQYEPHENEPISEAFLHIMTSMIALLSLKKGNISYATKMISKLPKITEMNSENLAGLNGFAAVFFSNYGLYGFKRAIDYVSKAIELNPNNIYWQFLKGKYLSRVRHVEQPWCLPSEEEKCYLEQAVNLKNKSHYLVYVADMYRETGSHVFFSQKNKNGNSFTKDTEIRELNKKSLEFYKKSLRLEPDSTDVMFRCARGLLQLPRPFCDYKKSKELLCKGLERTPGSGYGNHTMAKYYEKVEKDQQNAIKHLEICQEKLMFGATMDLLRLEYEVGKTSNLDQRLEGLYNIHHEKIYKIQILCHLMSLNLFISNDLKKACEYVDKIISIDSGFIRNGLKSQRPLFLKYYVSINMYEVLIDEIKIQKQNSQCSAEDEKYYDDFLNNLISIGEPVSLNKPAEGLKNKIMEAAKFEESNRNNRPLFTSDIGGRKMQWKFPDKDIISTHNIDAMLTKSGDSKIEKKKNSTHDNVKLDTTTTNTSDLSEQSKITATEASVQSWRKSSQGPTTSMRTSIKKDENYEHTKILRRPIRGDVFNTRKKVTTEGGALSWRKGSQGPITSMKTSVKKNDDANPKQTEISDTGTSITAGTKDNFTNDYIIELMQNIGIQDDQSPKSLSFEYKYSKSETDFDKYVQECRSGRKEIPSSVYSATSSKIQDSMEIQNKYDSNNVEDSRGPNTSMPEGIGSCFEKDDSSEGSEKKELTDSTTAMLNKLSKAFVPKKISF